jgi:hypothetical protein
MRKLATLAALAVIAAVAVAVSGTALGTPNGIGGF